MKFTDLPKEQQKTIIKGMAKRVADNIRDRIALAFHYEKGTKSYENFVKGWNKGEKHLLFSLESWIFLKTRFMDYGNDEEEKTLIQKATDFFTQKILKNKKFKRIQEKKDEKIIKKTISHEEVKIKRGEKLIGTLKSKLDRDKRIE